MSPVAVPMSKQPSSKAVTAVAAWWAAMTGPGRPVAGSHNRTVRSALAEATNSDHPPAPHTQLLVGHRDLRAAMTEVVRDAKQYLAVAGSRSRDAVYLEAIMTSLWSLRDAVAGWQTVPQVREFEQAMDQLPATNIV
jgi:hypothetical protein